MLAWILASYPSNSSGTRFKMCRYWWRKQLCFSSALIWLQHQITLSLSVATIKRWAWLRSARLLVCVTECSSYFWVARVTPALALAVYGTACFFQSFLSLRDYPAQMLLPARPSTTSPPLLFSLFIIPLSLQLLLKITSNRAPQRN
jgi:hypothetical protein